MNLEKYLIGDIYNIYDICKFNGVVSLFVLIFLCSECWSNTLI